MSWQGLQRHIGVFGPPEWLNSDMGSGFVKARRVIMEHADRFTTEGWDYVGKPKWEINVPYSPTWSSHVESMVKITKAALSHLHTGPTVSKLTPDEFYTQLKRCQGYINMRPLVQPQPDRPPLTPADFIGTGHNWLVSFLYTPEDKWASGYRYEQMEKIRKHLWDSFRTDYVNWLRSQSTVTEGLPEVGDLVLVKDVPSWKGDGWPVGMIRDIKTGSEEPWLYEIEIIPTEELRKEPQLINAKRRLLLNKKTILRNYRKLGFLPKIN